jgi:WD40 repeat protein
MARLGRRDRAPSWSSSSPVALPRRTAWGVVHRDLKPANVLLAGEATPKITDFGLAKSLAGESGLTRTDSIMGSPGYMAPEQAAGKAKDAGPAADVYALGAIYYELLTGRPPFRGASILETLEQSRTAEPVPPSRLVPGLPRDAETIALKCLQKEPGKRYDSASALAEDLRRFVAGEPIVARPVPAWERTVKWARRRTALATLLGTVVVLMASLLGLGVWSYVKINWALEQAQNLAKAEAQAKATSQQKTTLANASREALAYEDYINRVNRAYREVEDNNVALAEDLLHGCPRERRGWEWHFVKRLCHLERLSLEGPGGSISTMAFSPDGRVLAAGTGGHFSRFAESTNVALWDRSTGQRRTAFPGKANVTWSLAFSPDGSRLAVGGTKPQVAVRDLATGGVLWAKEEPSLPQAMSVVFSPDGKTLAVGFGSYSGPNAYQVKLYEVASGRETATYPGPKGGVNDMAFHRDGRRLAVAGSELIEVLDVSTGARVQELRGHRKWVYALAYSPDGEWLASGGWDRTAKLYNANTGEEKLTIFGHEGFVLDLAFSPDGRTLATTSEDRSIRLWAVPSGALLGTCHGHLDFVQAVAFSPDGKEIASGGLEGNLKLWDLRASLPVVFSGHQGWVGSLWYRRDGRRVVSDVLAYFRSPTEATKGWDPQTGELDASLTGVDPPELRKDYLLPSHFDATRPAHASTKDGRLVARVLVGMSTRSESDRSKEYTTNAIEILEAETGQFRHTLTGHTATVTNLAFSPDGQRLASTSYDRSIKLWDMPSGREVFSLGGHTAGVLAATFSPDGRRLVSGAIDFTARVWNATPLPDEVLLADDAHYQEKLAALRKLAVMTATAQSIETLARRGEWDLAAVGFGKLIAEKPDDAESRRRQILMFVEARKGSDVRRACTEMLQTFRGRGYEGQLSTVVWGCVLSPDSGLEPDLPIRLAEDCLSRCTIGERKDVQMTLVAALYRAGRYQDAKARLEESLQTGGESSPRIQASLAMANHRLKQPAEAQRWLDKLAAYQSASGADFSWDDVELRILRREAETTLQTRKP